MIARWWFRNSFSRKRLRRHILIFRESTGYQDMAGRIWIRDLAHAGVPDHWDVQVNGGQSYFRVDDNGNVIP
jgi:hypothetical protein